MLPPIIGTDVCSLVEGEERPALSVLATLDDEGVLVDARIVESTVRIARRLTYDFVDGALESGADEDIATLHRLADLRRKRRLAEGAVFIPFPSVEIHVEYDQECHARIEVRREEHDVPSQVLVSEFMILANEAAARYCVEHGIPAVFRGQPPPSEPIVISEPFTPLDGFKIRRFLRKGETALDPIRHSGLGVDAYIQFTSPIRRYLDLVMHRQIKTHLREGRPMYAREELQKIATITGSMSEQAETMERARKAYWLYRHLEESLWQERRATVLQTFPDRYHVQLHDTLIETDCPGAPGVPVSPGDRIDVRIELVWPREGTLRVSPVLERSPAPR
jgi:exoribonuclease-2